MDICAAGRTLREEPGGNPFWVEPCPNEGTDDLILEGQVTEDGEEAVSVVTLCRAHIIALNPERIA